MKNLNDITIIEKECTVEPTYEDLQLISKFAETYQYTIKSKRYKLIGILLFTDAMIIASVFLATNKLLTYNIVIATMLIMGIALTIFEILQYSKVGKLMNTLASNPRSILISSTTYDVKNNSRNIIIDKNKNIEIDIDGIHILHNVLNNKFKYKIAKIRDEQYILYEQ